MTIEALPAGPFRAEHEMISGISRCREFVGPTVCVHCTVNMMGDLWVSGDAASSAGVGSRTFWGRLYWKFVPFPVESDSFSLRERRVLIIDLISPLQKSP